MSADRGGEKMAPMETTGLQREKSAWYACAFVFFVVRTSSTRYLEELWEATWLLLAPLLLVRSKWALDCLLSAKDCFDEILQTGLA